MGGGGEWMGMDTTGGDLGWSYLQGIPKTQKAKIVNGQKREDFKKN